MPIIGTKNGFFLFILLLSAREEVCDNDPYSTSYVKWQYLDFMKNKAMTPKVATSRDVRIV